MDEYEARVQSLTEQLNKQVEIHRELDMRAQHFESSAYNLDSKLRSAEGELAASDVLREGFKFDKEKVGEHLMHLFFTCFFSFLFLSLLFFKRTHCLLA